MFRIPHYIYFVHQQFYVKNSLFLCKVNARKSIISMISLNLNLLSSLLNCPLPEFAYICRWIKQRMKEEKLQLKVFHSTLNLLNYFEYFEIFYFDIKSKKIDSSWKEAEFSHSENKDLVGRLQAGGK